jgi:hypothetical protein
VAHQGAEEIRRVVSQGRGEQFTLLFRALGAF